eukprot:GILJ01003730.1.p1 GENE.GILJ01003730.1~~GILJ01003730.1.p1  ORF type:complete len:466 (-),score=48.66 GILJ01003730.1:325-1722(-)
MLRPKLVVCLLLAVVCLLVPANTQATIDALGKAFYVPSTSLIDSLAGGISLFADLRNCITDVQTDETVSIQQFFQDTSSFYDYVASESKLELKFKGLFTLGSTLSRAARVGKGGNYSIKGTHIDTYSMTRRQFISRSCLFSSALSTPMLADFNALPAAVKEPHQAHSWEPYMQFLKKWGSHFVSSVSVGARMQQFTLTQSNTEFSRSDYEVKACLDLEGPVPWQGVSVDPCQSYTQEQRQQAAHLKMSSVLIIRGGEEQARAVLQTHRDAQSVQNFFSGAGKYGGPIQYAWEPIWNLFYYRFTAGKEFVIAKNLQAYYEGYMEHSCNYVQDGYQILRKFYRDDLRSKGDLPIWICMDSPAGCQLDTDCHSDLPNLGCFCYGDSCVQRNGHDVSVRHVQLGGTDEDVNTSCRRSLTQGCYCIYQNNWQDSTVYDSSDVGMNAQQHSSLLENDENNFLKSQLKMESY